MWIKPKFEEKNEQHQEFLVIELFEILEELFQPWRFIKRIDVSQAVNPVNISNLTGLNKSR